jgi:hypothetical protein
MLTKANKSAGLPVNIVRARQIGGPTTPARGVCPRQGFAFGMTKASQKVGMFPTHVQPESAPWALLYRTSQSTFSLQATETSLPE